MGASYYIKGVIGLPEDFDKMYKLVEACKTAKVSFPDDLLKYFFDKLPKDVKEYQIPHLQEMAVWLQGCKQKIFLVELLTHVSIKYTGNIEYEGATIDISQIPTEAKSIKIYMEA